MTTPTDRERAHAFIELERCNLCDDGKPKVLCSDCGNRMHARGRREALEEAARLVLENGWNDMYGVVNARDHSMALASRISALARKEGK
jgi:hypothetical protein